MTCVSHQLAQIIFLTASINGTDKVIKTKLRDKYDFVFWGGDILMRN